MVSSYTATYSVLESPLFESVYAVQEQLCQADDNCSDYEFEMTRLTTIFSGRTGINRQLIIVNPGPDLSTAVICAGWRKRRLSVDGTTAGP